MHMQNLVCAIIKTSHSNKLYLSNIKERVNMLAPYIYDFIIYTRVFAVKKRLLFLIELHLYWAQYL